MNNSDNERNPKKKEIKEFLEKDINKELEEKNESNSRILIKEEKKTEMIHLNSLITKNISLFTKNPNYKLLAWLIVQLTIFSLFIFAVNIFKNNLIPYFNS